MLAQLYAETSLDDVTDEQKETARKVFSAVSADGSGQGESFVALCYSPDPLGILLRGHVFIEVELEALINSTFLHPLDLHKDLECYFNRKLKLAHAIGVLHKDENDFLKRLNGIRNDLAHAKVSGGVDKRYVFTPKEEKQLWSQFIRVKSFEGFWPPYNDANFTMHLKAMVLTAQFLLFERAKRLNASADKNPTERLRLYRLDNMMRSGVVLLTVRHMPKFIRLIGRDAAPF